jgi:cytoskeletal protein RodZ
MNTWSCARCGRAAFADQNFCRACGTPRESARPAPITAQVPILRPDAKPELEAVDDRSTIDDPRTSAQQTGGIAEPGAAGRPARKRPISLVVLAAIAVAFLMLGGFVAVVFGNIRDDSNQEPSPTSVGPTVTVAPTTTRAPATTEPTTTNRPAATEPSPTTESPAATAAPSASTATSSPTNSSGTISSGTISSATIPGG